jgi:ubiquinone/menaquinone biosynthesis C-methylase UbiE
LSDLRLSGPWTPADVGRHFDAIYAALDRSPAHHAASAEALGPGYVGQFSLIDEPGMVRLAEVSSLRPGQRAIDLCCGAGGVAVRLAQLTGASIVGIDRSPVAVGLASARPHVPHVSYVLGDVARVPMRAARFHAVTCVDGFGSSVDELLRESARLLRPGGIAVLLLDLPAGADPGPPPGSLLRRVALEDLSDRAAGLQRSWASAIRRRAREHEREVGRDLHRWLLREFDRLADAFEFGRARRLLSTFEKDHISTTPGGARAGPSD